MTREEIFMAIGRAYAHEANENKEIDIKLAESIVDEIMKINTYEWICPVCKKVQTQKIYGGKDE